MAIDIDDARKAAHLARIRVTEDELPGIASELQAILGFMSRLNDVDVTDVEPMSSATPMQLKSRSDDVDPTIERAHVVANAPDSREGFFVVPKVVE